MSAEGAGFQAEETVPAEPSEFKQEQGAERPGRSVEGGEGMGCRLWGGLWVDMFSGR